MIDADLKALRRRWARPAKKPGRKALTGESRRATLLSLTDADRALLQRIGNGNFTEGARRLIAHYRQAELDADPFAI